MAVRSGLKNGDLTPWTPFSDLAPGPPGNQQTADFQITDGSSGPPAFAIKGKSYDPNLVSITRLVNTTDDFARKWRGGIHIGRHYECNRN